IPTLALQEGAHREGIKHQQCFVATAEFHWNGKCSPTSQFPHKVAESFEFVSIPARCAHCWNQAFLPPAVEEQPLLRIEAQVLVPIHGFAVVVASDHSKLFKQFSNVDGL